LKLLRLPTAPNDTRFVTWPSKSASLQDSDAARGHAPDHARGAPDNAVALRVDFETCSYTLGASVKMPVAQVTLHDDEPQGQPAWRRVATFAATDLPLQHPDEITAELPAQAVRDVNDTTAGPARWVPAGSPDAWRTAGQAQLRWHLVSATKAALM
jgi:hypothetical protein